MSLHVQSRLGVYESGQPGDVMLPSTDVSKEPPQPRKDDQMFYIIGNALLFSNLSQKRKKKLKWLI